MVFHQVNIETLKSFWLPRRKEYHDLFRELLLGDNFLSRLSFLAIQAWKKSKVQKRTKYPRCLHIESNHFLLGLQPRNKFHHFYTIPECDARTIFGERYTNLLNFLSNGNRF